MMRISIPASSPIDPLQQDVESMMAAQPSYEATRGQRRKGKRKRSPFFLFYPFPLFPQPKMSCARHGALKKNPHLGVFSLYSA
jgi:hypothetical protein